jgi:hypothetical protein
MSTDRELLELAAKAAGVELWPHGDPWRYQPAAMLLSGGCETWNPLTDDGDALRLAVKLELDILFYRKHVDVCDNTKTQNVAAEEFTSGRDLAVRRAIVRAAAEIGGAMP